MLRTDPANSNIYTFKQIPFVNFSLVRQPEREQLLPLMNLFERCLFGVGSGRELATDSFQVLLNFLNDMR